MQSFVMSWPDWAAMPRSIRQNWKLRSPDQLLMAWFVSSSSVQTLKILIFDSPSRWPAVLDFCGDFRALRYFLTVSNLVDQHPFGLSKQIAWVHGMDVRIRPLHCSGDLKLCYSRFARRRFPLVGRCKHHYRCPSKTPLAC